MLILRDPVSVASVEDAYIRSLLDQRFEQLTSTGGPIDQTIYFVLIEPGDTPEAIETAEGIWITRDVFDDACYGDPDFAPSFDLLEAHPGCFEMLFNLGEGATTLIVPDRVEIDPTLLRFCREFATPAC